jgi:hypothetical protein
MRAMVAVLATAACMAATPVHAGKKKQATPRECTADLTGLPVTPVEQLVAKRKGMVLFNAKSPCFVREGQPPLPVAVLELPPFDGPYVLRFESIITNAFVMPRIEMLDEDGMVTRVIDATAFRKRTSVVSADVFVKLENAGERRVRVFPDPGEIGKSEQRTVMAMQSTYIYTGSWMSGTDTTHSINQVDAGRVQVSLIGDAWDERGRRRKP